MLFRTADFHPVGAGRNDIGQGGVRIKLGAELVEIGNFELAPLAHRAAIRHQLAQDEAQQGGLAGTIGADQTDLVTTLDAGGEIAHHRTCAIRLADVFQLSHQLATAITAFQLQADLSHALAARLTLGTQLIQALHTKHRPRAPRFHAFANPDLFLLEQFVGTRIGQCFFVQQRFLARLILAEIARKTHQLAAIQFDDAGADAIQETTIMGDKQQGHARFDQQRFQPLNGGDIEVIGRLIEQQHVRRHRQRLRQGQAFFLPAGQTPDQRLRIQRKTGNHLFRLRLVGPGATRFQLVLQSIHPRQQGLGIAPFRELLRHCVILRQQRRSFPHPGNHRLEDRCLRIKWRLLRHIGKTQARLQPDLAIIQPPPPTARRNGRQQGGFAGAVAPDQGNPLTGIQLQLGMIEQGNMAIGQAGSSQFETGHGKKRPKGCFGRDLVERRGL